MERGNALRLLAENQLVGNGRGFAVVRDLTETESGERVSVKKSAWFEVTAKTKIMSRLDLIRVFPVLG